LSPAGGLGILVIQRVVFDEVGGRALHNVSSKSSSRMCHSGWRYHIHPDRPPRRPAPTRDGLATYR